MAENDDFADGVDDQGTGQGDDDDRVTLSKQDVQQLREAAKRGSGAQRELAFYKAGLDLDQPGVSYFVKGYDGELDPAKIREEAEKAGFLKTAEGGGEGEQQQDTGDGQTQQPQQQGGSQVSGEERDALREIHGASRGSEGSANTDPIVAIENASSPEEVLEEARRAGRWIADEV